jgi:hypothetical protein
VATGALPTRDHCVRAGAKTFEPNCHFVIKNAAAAQMVVNAAWQDGHSNDKSRPRPGEGPRMGIASDWTLASGLLQLGHLDNI